ncbi:hypothetical protein ABPG74_017548, partial [Tetrahymena malaccensis]
NNQNLNYCNLGKELGEISQLQSVDLDLSKNGIDGKTISLIVSELDINKKLLTLNLTLKYQNLKCQDMIPLGVALSKLQNINKLKLDLNNNQISSKGFYELINGIENCSRLQYLSIDLSQNLINNSFQSGQQNNQNLKINEPQKNQIFAKSSQLSSLLLSFDNQSQVISDFKEFTCQIKKFSSLKYIQIDQFKEIEEWEWDDQDSVQLDFPQILKRKCSKLEYSFSSQLKATFANQQYMIVIWEYINVRIKVQLQINTSALLIIIAKILSSTHYLIKCNQGIINSDLNLYQCLDCSLVIDIRFCNLNCQNLQFYSQSTSKCMTYCGNGFIEYMNCNSNYNLCIDGFIFSKDDNKCIKVKSCQQQIFDKSLNLFLCSNCGLASDIVYCFKGCSAGYFSQTQDCKNSCQQSEYFSQSLGYANLNLFLCQNCGLTTDTKLCVCDKYQFNQQSKQCTYKQTCPLYTDNYIKYCNDCGVVTLTQSCQNSCSNNQYYSQQYKQCMYYCGSGLIAKDKNSCSLTLQCVDGLQLKTYQKCENIQQTACPYTTLPDSFVKICSNCSLVSDKNQCNFCVCEERIVESTLKLYQCPNCSLVTNTQFCKNSCAVSQVYSYANCMVHCGNGLIAKDQMSCQSSNLCIEGFIFTSQGICNPKDSKINQEMDQNFILINILIPLFLVFFIVIFLCWVVKKLKFVSQTQAKDQELQKQQYEEAKIKILKHQQEIDYLKQKENIKPQNELNQNQIILNINNENDIEEQSLSKQTVNMIENFNPYQQNIDSQQQFQQLPILENQESS